MNFFHKRTLAYFIMLSLDINKCVAIKAFNWECIKTFPNWTQCNVKQEGKKLNNYELMLQYGIVSTLRDDHRKSCYFFTCFNLSQKLFHWKATFANAWLNWLFHLTIYCQKTLRQVLNKSSPEVSELLNMRRNSNFPVRIIICLCIYQNHSPSNRLLSSTEQCILETQYVSQNTMSYKYLSNRVQTKSKKAVIFWMK